MFGTKDVGRYVVLVCHKGSRSSRSTKSAFYGRLREVTDAQRPLLPRPFAGEKKERKRDRQARGKNLRPGWAGHGGGKARGGWDSWEGPARGGWRRRRMIRRRMGRGGIILNKYSGTGRESDEYA